jgi:23S rRNA-/tRNA-specific pseudouridylate synthase
LHAAELRFSHPRSGEPLHFARTLPQSLADLLDQLD